MENPIQNYLDQTGMTQAHLARGVGIPKALVNQYIKNKRPVSDKVCVRIETFTNGALCRKVLRPSDWQEVWPELIQENSHA